MWTSRIIITAAAGSQQNISLSFFVCAGGKQKKDTRGAMKASRVPAPRQRKPPRLAFVVDPSSFEPPPELPQRRRAYDFGTDRSYRYLDVDLAPYARDLTTRFVAWIALTVLVELTLLAWPIVATILWRSWAALTWMAFGYAIRVVALLAAAIEVGSRVHRLAGRPVTRRCKPHNYISLTLGTAFAPSPSLMTWYVLAMLQAALTALVLLFTLVAAPAFTARSKGLLLGLTLGFQVVSILQSLAWPGIIYTFGVRRQIRLAVATARRRRWPVPPVWHPSDYRCY